MSLPKSSTDATPPTMRKRRVVMGGRVFFVGRHPDGGPRNIVERRARADGKIKSSTYWHRSHGLPRAGRKGRTRSIVREILAQAGMLDTRQIADH